MAPQVMPMPSLDEAPVAQIPCNACATAFAAAAEAEGAPKWPLGEEVLKAALLKVEGDISGSFRNVGKKCAQEVVQFQKAADQTTDKFAKAVADMHESHLRLESENTRLKDMIKGLANFLGAKLDASVPCAAVSPSASTVGGSAPGGLKERQPPMVPSYVPAVPAIPIPPEVALPVSVPKLVPGTATTPPATLSLADALGLSKGNAHAPNSMVTALAPPMEDIDGFIFNLTLRVADGGNIGLVTSHGASSGCALHINQVLPGGAVEAWNRLCSNGAAAERVLCPGDRIVSVNDISCDPQRMSQEVMSRRLVRLQVVRTGRGRSPLVAPAA
jgi:hypothetical protein